MRLQRLNIDHVRNLESVRLSELAQINVFFGANGSGKTSVLEAVHLLALARSFRSRRIDSVIRHGQAACTVWGEVIADSGRRHALGVQRSREGRPGIKLDGAVLASLAELAGVLPVQLINADSFNLLEGAPSFRRQLLDWGVFHVEHSRFFDPWQRYRRALRQRNSLLRRGRVVAEEIRVWDQELCAQGEMLHRLRERYFESFRDEIFQGLAELGQYAEPLPQGLELDYQSGWERETPLAESLQRHYERDSRSGHTGAGPHRADIRIRLNGLAASEVLSRGQTKMLVCAARLAQAKLLQRCGINSVFLIDDLPAELDREHRRAVCRVLMQMGLQLFVTCIGAEDLDDCWQDNNSYRFHVEHGRVSPAAP